MFISGRASDALDALRRRLAADSNLELVDRPELADAVVSLPAASAGIETDGSPVPQSIGSGSRRHRPAREHEELIEPLTVREHDVLELLADGLPNRDIASALAISEHTVKFHLASIFGKLGASTRTEAVHRGVRLGVIEI